MPRELAPDERDEEFLADACADADQRALLDREYVELRGEPDVVEVGPGDLVDVLRDIGGLLPRCPVVTAHGFQCRLRRGHSGPHPAGRAA